MSKKISWRSNREAVYLVVCHEFANFKFVNRVYIGKIQFFK